MGVRLGRQEPTRYHIIPYKATEGERAIEIYNSTGRTAMAWQELLMNDMMAQNEEGLWTHTKYGYSIPRRNGKSELLVARELYALFNGEDVLHTAHLTKTAHSSWERLKEALNALGYINRSEVRKDDDVPIERQYMSYKALGSESIEMCMDGGGRVNFRTRTTKGGLGEGYDVLIVDEAQEYQEDQESSLKYVVSDSQNPQTIMCGTPPTPISSGTVFVKFRENTLGGKNRNAGWAEWSVDRQTDPNDVESWYLTNPSMGTILTERKVGDEIGTDDIDFNIQRLGWWIQYNQKSAISDNEWNSIKVDELPELRGKLFVGIKFGSDGTNVAMSIAVKTVDGNIFIEAIDCKSCRSGNDWLLKFLKTADIQKVVIDGAQGEALAGKMKDLKLKTPIIPKVKEVIMANSSFEQAIVNKTIRHKGQPSLREVATNCEHRAIGTSGGFGYRCTVPELDIILLESCSLAYWACSTFREGRKQKVSY